MVLSSLLPSAAKHNAASSTCPAVQTPSVCAYVQIALFAGRRSSDRAYLLLQTWFCAHNLKNYIGSSSIFAFSHLSRVMQEEGLYQPEERIQQIGRLDQLMSNITVLMTFAISIVLSTMIVLISITFSAFACCGGSAQASELQCSQLILPGIGQYDFTCQSTGRKQQSCELNANTHMITWF